MFYQNSILKGRQKVSTPACNTRSSPWEFFLQLKWFTQTLGEYLARSVNDLTRFSPRRTANANLLVAAIMRHAVYASAGTVFWAVMLTCYFNTKYVHSAPSEEAPMNSKSEDPTSQVSLLLYEINLFFIQAVIM